MKKITYLLFLTATLSFSQDWKTDIDQAKKIASNAHKKIVLVFSGSDWCAPCIKLEREIWDTDVFKSYATDHYVMLKADFPKRKKNALSKEQQAHNNLLAETYNKNGYFPFVVVLDKNGTVLGQTGYQKITPQTYIKLINAY